MMSTTDRDMRRLLIEYPDDIVDIKMRNYSKLGQQAKTRLIAAALSTMPGTIQDGTYAQAGKYADYALSV